MWLSLLAALLTPQNPAAPLTSTPIPPPAAPTSMPAASAPVTIDNVNIDPLAVQYVQEMGDYLAARHALRFVAGVRFDEVDGDETLEFSRRAVVTLLRPDKLHTASIGDNWNKEYWFDGKTMTLLDRGSDVYSQTEAPATVDAMLDHIAGAYGLTTPLADFLFSQPHAAMLSAVESGRYVGEHRVGDFLCHHVAFRQPSIDWQLWIDSSEQPLPRKLVITYKQQPGRPQYSVEFQDWQTGILPPADLFQFVPPESATRVALEPASGS